MHWLVDTWLVQHLLHWTGSDNVSGPEYGFWSGFGSDIAEFAILGGLIQWYRHATCHVDTCWRLGLHQVHGTQFKTCRKHHPAGGNSHQDILDAHAAASS